MVLGLYQDVSMILLSGTTTDDVAWIYHNSSILQTIADFSHFYKPFPSLMTKMVHLKFKDNLGLLEVDTDITNTNNFSACLVNTIKLLIAYFILRCG